MSERFAREGLSFDDVLLVPRRSAILPRDTDIATRLTARIQLNIPILSAPMDMVTESELAIALAREGGLGIIHRNMPVESQCSEVDRVKRSESGMIVNPVTITPESPIREALAIMQRYRISGLPVTEDKRLVGILTNRDLRFETNFDRPAREAMTSTDLITAPVGTTLDQAKVILHEHRIEKLPVVDEEFSLRGLITIKDIEKIEKYPHATKDHLGRLRVGAAVGVGPEARERVAALLEKECDAIVVDTAHGHGEDVLRTVAELKGAFPAAQIIAGNIATGSGAADLIAAGADALRVGMGPGATCTTRVVTGAGVPQVTAISEAAAVAREHDIPVIADGGIKYSGDVTKAIAAGADCVMIGALFAGTEEGPGERVLYMGRTYKQYRGMGSIGAMKGRTTVRDRYHQEHVETESKLVPEGIEGRVPYKGPLAGVVHQLVGGLRAGMGLCGCQSIPELQRDTAFTRITAAGLAESHPHDILITEEAPNYQIRD